MHTFFAFRPPAWKQSQQHLGTDFVMRSLREHIVVGLDLVQTDVGGLLPRVGLVMLVRRLYFLGQAARTLVDMTVGCHVFASADHWRALKVLVLLRFVGFQLRVACRHRGLFHQDAVLKLSFRHF